MRTEVDANEPWLCQLGVGQIRSSNIRPNCRRMMVLLLSKFDTVRVALLNNAATESPSDRKTG